MSESADTTAEGPERRSLAALEGAVGRLLEETERLRTRAREAEERSAEIETLLRRFTRGEDDPTRLQQRVVALEGENQDLRERIEEGRAGVERLLARIRFLEEAE